MTNIRLKHIDDYEDVATKNAYHSFHRGEPQQKRIRRVHLASRDSARTPVQWSDERYAGFSTVRPWFFVNPNYRKINAAAQEKDPDSILHFYRRCLALRKSSDTLLKGDYREYYPLNGELYMYERRYRNEHILVVCSFTEKEIRYRLPRRFSGSENKLILDNYADGGRIGRLRPYEAHVLQMNEAL